DLHHRHPLPRTGRRGSGALVTAAGGRGLREGERRGRRGGGEREDVDEEAFRLVEAHGFTTGRTSELGDEVPVVPTVTESPGFLLGDTPFLGARAAVLLLRTGRPSPAARTTGREESAVSASPSPSLGDTRTTSRSGRSRSARAAGGAGAFGSPRASA